MASNAGPQRRNKSNPEIPTSSMADIAFLLIVFFLVTTSLNQDKGIGMQLPPEGQTKKIRKKNICNVWVNAEGQILINQQEQVPLNQLQANVEQRLRENDKLIISLKADENTPYDTFIHVLDKLKLSGADRISLASPQ